MTLPKHQRSRRSFSATFGTDPKQTIAAMDRGGHDIPNQTPATRLALQRVGVRRRSIPIQLKDPLGSGGTVQLSCAVDAHLQLGPDQRGIHVSRIGDLVARLSGEVHLSLGAYAERVNQELRAAQACQSAGVSVEGVFTYLEEVRGVKQKASLEHLELFAAADFHEGEGKLSNGVGFSHLTACPCVQETFRHTLVPDLPSSRKGHAQPLPLLTHTQRCQTRITLSELPAALDLPALLSCIDALVVRSQNTLPRELELLNVYRAHARPQFLEDALRDLMFGVYQAIGPRSPAAAIRIQTISLESIHDFDMEGEIALTVKELDRHFASRAPESNQNAGRKNPGNPR